MNIRRTCRAVAQNEPVGTTFHMKQESRMEWDWGEQRRRAIPKLTRGSAIKFGHLQGFDITPEGFAQLEEYYARVYDQLDQYRLGRWDGPDDDLLHGMEVFPEHAHLVIDGHATCDEPTTTLVPILFGDTFEYVAWLEVSFAEVVRTFLAGVAETGVYPYEDKCRGLRSALLRLVGEIDEVVREMNRLKHDEPNPPPPTGEDG